MVVVVVPQLGDRAVPVPVGGARGRQRLGIAVGYEHLADDPHLGRGHVAIEPVRRLAMRLPGLPVRIHKLAHTRSRAEADEMVAVPGRIHDALRVIRGIPQRRVWLLQGMQLHGDVVILVVLALEGQPRLRQPGHEDGQGLVEDGARLSGIDPEVAQLIGRDTAPDAEIQASA